MAGEPLTVEEAVARLEVYRRQIEAANRSLSLMQAVFTETARARATLEDWKSQDAGSTLLVPIGGNTFVHATLANREKTLLGVGAGYSVERPIAEAIQHLEAREKEIAQEADRLGAASFELQQEAAGLEEAIEESLARPRGPEGAKAG